MAQDYVEQAAWRLIRSDPAWMSRRYLEMGCGDATTLEALVDAGATDARGTTYRSLDEDYIRERAFPEKLIGRIDEGVDLTAGLPHGDSRFDVVYSLEVIEHVEAHRRFIAEAARVLTVGGRLILTTPNLHRLGSRFRFLLTGLHQTKRELPDADVSIDSLEEFHQRCVDFASLHHILWRAGLRIRALEVTKAKPMSRALMALWPIMRLTTGRALFRKAPAGKSDEYRRDLQRWMMSPALMLSEQICLLAEKIDEGDRFRADAPQTQTQSTISTPAAASGMPEVKTTHTQPIGSNPDVERQAT